MTGATARNYVLHGLTVDSDIPLPVPLGSRAAAPDLRLVQAQAGSDLAGNGHRVAASFPRPGEPPAALFHRPSSVVVRFAGVADIRIAEDATEVTVAPVQGADEDLLLDLVLGLPFAYILLRRHLLPVHASAVAYGAGSAVLVAPSLTGKSTLAAACLAAGARLVADDLVAVDPGPGATVIPGVPAIRLADDSLSAAGHPPGPLIRHTRRGWKHWLRTDGRLAEGPSAAAALLFLERASGEAEGSRRRAEADGEGDQGPGLHAISPAAAAARLSAQVYGFTMLPPAERRSALAAVATVLEEVPCRRLVLADDLTALAGAAAAVGEAVADAPAASPFAPRPSP